MNEFDQEIRDALAADPVQLPEKLHLQTEQLLNSLPEKEPVRRLRLLPRVTALAASLLFVLLVLFPNLSPAYAESLQSVPVIGELVHIFTIRSYLVDENQHNLDAQIPAVQDRVNPEASRLINMDVDELTGEVIRQFYEELELSSGQGVGSIHIDYEVLTNTEHWFTLKLSVEETRGSTMSYSRYYHIDRIHGAYVQFGDLVAAEFYPVLEDMIKAQIRQQMDENPEIIYFENKTSGAPFVRLDPDQGFYFREDGDLVIVYDRYEIAPGSMGCPSFVLPRADISGYLNEAYLPD